MIEPVGIDPQEFRRALGQFAAGITIVTTRDPLGTPYGLTVTAFCSVSLVPPLVLVSIDRHSDANAGLAASSLFGVSILSEDQEPVSRRFATSGIDKFAGLPLVTGPHGAALIPGALAHIECRVASVYPGGDHTIYLGRVLGLTASPGRPLVYHGSAYCRLAASMTTGDKA